MFGPGRHVSDPTEGMSSTSQNRGAQWEAATVTLDLRG
jgi:hypothetical protein